MLIKVDKWLDSVLEDTDSLLYSKTKFINIGEDKYIDFDEIVGAIENLNEELIRVNEKVEKYDRDIQEYYQPKKYISREYGE